MCRTKEEIMVDDIIIQEIDEHIKRNNLAPLELLTLRVMKYNRIDVLQVKDDIAPVLAHVNVCKKNPSLVWYFRNNTGKTVAVVSSILFCTYVILGILETLIGFDVLIKSLLP